MNCLVVDDDYSAIVATKLLIRKVTGLNLLAECYSATQAFEILQKTTVDLLFLDIQMPDITGLELVKSMGAKTPLIIFVTTSPDFATDAYALNVVDYLVKPLTLPRFLQAVQKAQLVFNSTKSTLTSQENDCFFIRDKGLIQRINISSVLYFESFGDFLKLHTLDKMYIISSSLRYIEERFPPAIFIRIHRRYIVAINNIEKVDKDELYIGKKTLPVSESYRNHLYKHFNLL